MHKKLIWQYYVLSCLFRMGSFHIMSAIYVSFLLKNGLNLFETNLTNAIFFTTIFLCEIPTGAFADIFGRKVSFIFASALMCVSLFVYGSSHTLGGFIIAEIMGAVAHTFETGAFKAWFVDSLKHHGHEGDLTEIFSRESFWSRIIGGSTAILGSYLLSYNPVLPWFVGGGIMGVTTLLALVVMKEEYFVRTAFSFKLGFQSMRNIAVKSIRYGMEDKAVRFVIVTTTVQIFAVQSLNMYWQPFLGERGMPEKHYGFVFTAITIMLALGAFVTSRFKTAGKEKKIILRSQIVVGILAIIASLIPGLHLALVFYLLQEIPRGCWTPLMDSYLHKRIPSSERATIESFCSIAPHLGGALGLLTSGVIAYFFGITVSWVVAGVFLIFGALLILKNGDKVHE